MPVLLDLFCGAGLAGEGYRQAGFDVVGVDIEPHTYFPNPGGFILGDALEVLADAVAVYEPDIIHASPPCPRWSTATNATARQRHADLLTPTRAALERTGLPYIIENVPGAPLRDPVRVCGSAFEELGVRRHRMFETNVDGIVGTDCYHARQGQPWGVYGQHGETRVHARVAGGTSRGRKAHNAQHAAKVMGVPLSWEASWSDIKDGIPPAYTKYLGAQLLCRT